MKFSFSDLSKGINDLVLVVGMIGILMVLFTPIDPSTLDFLLILNFAFALLILVVTFYTEKPLAFSTFPSILLMTTLFRLALNISATRMILDQTDAGRVIDAVGTHVVGGNYIIGLVVFLILIVVQFVVVTNGAQRVAEVAARFILDSLPGKQMSIDADLNMGIIDQDEAKKRRSDLEKESNFYGAMDGASKFVKGDAIAGIIIILIDIIGGLIIGIAQLGMSWGEALHVYTLLTVGDGIVTQIPSLVVAVSTGIIITRAATDAPLAGEIAKQFSAHPKTLIIVAVALLALSLLPGIPVMPIMIIVSALFVFAWFSYKKILRSDLPDDVKAEEETANDSDDREVLDLISTQPFELALGKSLSDEYLSSSAVLEQRVNVLKKQIAQQLGIIIPPLFTKTDLSLKADGYLVSINGVSLGAGNLKTDALLAINPGGDRIVLEGEKTREPTYGLPAQWISPELRTQAHAAGYTLVEPETVLMTHIQEICKRNGKEFLTRLETEKLIESRREKLGPIIDELVPTIMTYSDIQRIFQALVSEQVPIKNIEAILEVLVDIGRQIKEPEIMVEKVRERLGTIICSSLNDKQGQLQVMTLVPQLERKLLNSASSTEKTDIGLSPQELEFFVRKTAKECEKMLSVNLNPIMLCAAPLRKILRNLLARTCPQLHILSTAEVNTHENIVSAGLIDIDMQNDKLAQSL